MTENADDSARLATLLANTRTLLANTRTLLAYIRTALAFAGLGFAVAKFGLNPKMNHVSGYLGTFMVLVGLLVTTIGFAQHRDVLREVEPSPWGLASSRVPMLRQLSAVHWSARSWPFILRPASLKNSLLRRVDRS